MMNKMFVLDAAHMMTADEGTIKKLDINQDVLMEKAALAVAERVKLFDCHRVLCVCGVGNNGADAIAVARILLMQGICAEVYLCAEPDKSKEAVLKQYNIFKNVGGVTVTTTDFEEYDIIVDGIFGIGIKREVEGIYAKAVKAIDKAKENGSKVIAIDIPSGIHTDRGVVLGMAVKADETVTFGYLKPGHLLYPGAEYCGKVTVADIGIYHKYFYDEKELHCFTVPAVGSIDLPKRKRNGNKGSFGRVLVIAGSATMYGACYLSALAALRMGAGLVDIYTHEVNSILVRSMLPEGIVHTYDNEGYNKAELQELMNRADCVVLGPGLSTEGVATELVAFVLEHCEKNIVTDADALNCIAMEKQLLSTQKKFVEREMIITPHPGELSRLTGLTVNELKENYIENIRAFAKEYRLIVVGKGAGTVVSDGEKVYLNQTGNDGMATAGSGDVLSGIIGALCAGKMKAFEAAWKGVFLHGKAGDKAIETSNTHSLMAGDIADALKEIL